jgi:aspartyl-tRNA(Asn)/glutamyl-tRNA(Gln) amidotransferase subunit B
MSVALESGTLLDVNGVAYEAVIGMECHVELKTATKMFCGCRNVFGGEPNTNICPVCLGMPGALPVPNGLAIEHVLRAGLAFGASVPAFSKFDRKNYFYPDMPKNYQISQFDLPFTSGGTVTFRLPDGSERSVRLSRIHLEEDTGKSMHLGSSDGRLAGSTHSLVDFNRAGVPLMECVSEPDLRSAVEAVAYLEALKRTFVTLGVSDVKMEEGSLRCDANVSLRPAGSEAYGTKTEIKNMNSFRSVQRAIESELARQASELAAGRRIVQQTRGWDESQGTTIVQRSKEEAHDYRYFPDPDLVPFEFTAAYVDGLRAGLGVLPQVRVERYVGHGWSVAQAQQIVDTPGMAAYYDAVVDEHGAAPQAAGNFILGDLTRLANESGTAIAESGLSPQRLAEIVKAVGSGSINSKIAKGLIEDFWDVEKSKTILAELGDAAGSDVVSAYIVKRGLSQVSDLGAIDALVAEVIAANPKVADDFRAGKEKVIGFLVGQVMKASRGKANPALAEERLRAHLAAG